MTPEAAGPGPTVAIVGAGFTGLSAAYELVQHGWRPIVVEQEEEIGGLAASFPVAGIRLERFYHHWFTSDREILRLTDELGLRHLVTDRATSTGMYFANQHYRLARPLDLLRFRPLGLLDRLRLGLLVLRARRVADWRELDGVSAFDWLQRLGGRRVFEVVWEPLLRGKFSGHAERISAAWFWSKLMVRGGSRGRGGEERLCYLEGGFSRLTDAMAKAIRAGGGEVRTGCRATGVLMREERCRGLTLRDGRIEAKAVVFTGAPRQAAALLGPEAPPHYASQIGAIDYLANVCLVLDLVRNLSDLYWINVNDPGFPFVGVIEHTNFDSDPADRRHLVFLSRYLPADDPAWADDDKAVLEKALPHLAGMFPQFDREWIRSHHVWRARWAQPLVEVGYAARIPAPRSPLPGFYLASMAQVYPQDRGTNYAVRDGRAVASLVMRDVGAPAT
jgi:protoporphyrinogen oxidase